MDVLTQIEDDRLLRIKPENHLQLVEHFVLQLQTLIQIFKFFIIRRFSY